MASLNQTLTLSTLACWYKEINWQLSLASVICSQNHVYASRNLHKVCNSLFPPADLQPITTSMLVSTSCVAYWDRQWLYPSWDRANTPHWSCVSCAPLSFPQSEKTSTLHVTLHIRLITVFGLTLHWWWGRKSGPWFTVFFLHYSSKLSVHRDNRELWTHCVIMEAEGWGGAL